MDLVNQLQGADTERDQIQSSSPSPGLSESTCDKNASKLGFEDDDFADSPILYNSNALLRAKSKHKAPVARKMKLKPISAAPNHKPASGFMAFQAENRLRVRKNPTTLLCAHVHWQMKCSFPMQNARELTKALGLQARNAHAFMICASTKLYFADAILIQL